MATGVKHIIKIHENEDGDVVLDKFERKEFHHTSAFSVATSAVVTKEDFTGSVNDAYIVEISYPSGTEPNLTTANFDELKATAQNAVNALYGDGEAGDPTT